MDVRIDWRSYERQGAELLAQVYEGPAVRAMEKRGILTEKGDYNRWLYYESHKVDITEYLSGSSKNMLFIKNVNSQIMQTQNIQFTHIHFASDLL